MSGPAAAEDLKCHCNALALPPALQRMAAPLISLAGVCMVNTYAEPETSTFPWKEGHFFNRSSRLFNGIHLSGKGIPRKPQIVHEYTDLPNTVAPCFLPPGEGTRWWVAPGIWKKFLRHFYLLWRLRLLWTGTVSWLKCSLDLCNLTVTPRIIASGKCRKGPGRDSGQ